MKSPLVETEKSVLENNLTWVPHISADLASRGTDCICPGLFFQLSAYQTALEERVSVSLWSKGQFCRCRA